MRVRQGARTQMQPSDPESRFGSERPPRCQLAYRSDCDEDEEVEENDQ